MSSKRKRIAALAVNLAGVLAFVLILYLGGLRAWDQILKSDWPLMLAALGVTLIWNVIATYRWAIIADRVTESADGCPFRYYFTYHMLGMLLGQVAPITVGMLGGRPAALSLSRGVPLTRSALSVFLDKFFDLILALLLVLPTAFYLVGVVNLLSLSTLGQQFSAAGAAERAPLQAIANSLVSIKDHAGLVAVFAFCLGAFLYYYAFFQSRLIPRWLSGFGVVATILMMTACVLALFSGNRITSYIPLAAPIAVQEMVLAVWLIVKGFSPSAKSREPSAIGSTLWA